MTVYEHTQQFHVKDPFSALTHFIGFIQIGRAHV